MYNSTVESDLSRTLATSDPDDILVPHTLTPGRGTLTLTFLPFLSILIMALFVWQARTHRHYKLVRKEGDCRKTCMAVALGGASLLLLRAFLTWQTPEEVSNS